jgi:hypothetical protein
VAAVIHDLRKHPEYWRLLGDLPEAVRVLVVEDNATLYLAVRQARAPEASLARHARRVAFMRTLIADIRDNGYDKDRWRSDPRFGGLVPGFGPITVVRSGATVFPRDGAHRASILRALDRPVPAEVYSP